MSLNENDNPAPKTMKDHLKTLFIVSITFIIIGVLVYFEMK
jgi:hypothetical protein